MILLLKSTLLKINYNHETLKHNSLNTLCSHNLETLIANSNLHIKNVVHTAIEQSFPSLLVLKINEMRKTKETSTLFPNLLKNHLYNTSVLLLVTINLKEQTTKPKDPMIDFVVEVHHVIVIQTVILHHKIDIVLTPETDTDVTELLLLHKLTDPDMTTTDEIHVLIIHHTDLHIDRHIEETHAIRSRSYSRDRQFQQCTSSNRPPSQPRESRPFRSRSSSETKNNVNNIQTEQSKSPIIFEIQMYHPTKMTNALIYKLVLLSILAHS